MNRVILKVSGEALSGSKGFGLDANYVEKIALEIKALYEVVDEIGVVCGAGNFWRGRDANEHHMDRASADDMGMLGTIMNALALQGALERLGFDTRVLSSISMPSICETYIRRKALAYLKEKKIVIFAGGTGHPFFSTDTAASLKAVEMKADCILMGKNGVDGVYSADPKRDPQAKKYDRLSYDEIIEKHLMVMDLTSVTLCQENKIKIVVFDINKEHNIKTVVTNPTIGTIIE